MLQLATREKVGDALSTSVHENAALAAYRWGGFALAMVLGSVLMALALEHLGGYAPCPLCYLQRYAYYAGIPLLFAALVLVSADVPKWAGAVFFLVAIGFLANAGLGVYHAGAEWGYWPGPETCTSVGSGGLAPIDLSSGLAATAPAISCTEPALRVFGLSLAGWNVIASLAIHISALKAAAASLNKS